MADRLLRLREMAEIFGRVSTRTVRRMAADGRVPPPVRVRPMAWRQSDVDAFLRRLSVTAQLQDDARRTTWTPRPANTTC